MGTTYRGILPGSPTFDHGEETSKATIEYSIEADSLLVGGIEVLQTAGLPVMYQLYSFGTESHLSMRVKNRSARRVMDNSRYWVVTIDFETSKEKEDEDENPINDRVQISETDERFEVPIQGEENSESEPWSGGILNSAGEPFPVMTKDEYRPVLRMERNEAIDTDMQAKKETYLNHGNADAFFGRPAGFWVCRKIDYSVEEKKVGEDGDSIPYLAVSYEFLGSGQPSKDHDLYLLDHGTYYIDGSDKVAFTTDDTPPQPRLGLLDGAGDESATPVYLDPLRIYSRVNYADLDLPQSPQDVFT